MRGGVVLGVLATDSRGDEGRRIQALMHTTEALVVFHVPTGCPTPVQGPLPVGDRRLERRPEVAVPRFRC